MSEHDDYVLCPYCGHQQAVIKRYGWFTKTNPERSVDEECLYHCQYCGFSGTSEDARKKARDDVREVASRRECDK